MCPREEVGNKGIVRLQLSFEEKWINVIKHRWDPSWSSVFLVSRMGLSIFELQKG